MKEKTLVEINRLIAEFMGYEVINYKGKPTYNGNEYAKTFGEKRKLWGGLDLHFTGRLVRDVEYPFNTDFNYLLPVIKKLEDNGYVVHIAGISYKIYKVLDETNPIVSLCCGDTSKKTEMVCSLITQFIEETTEKKEI